MYVLTKRPINIETESALDRRATGKVFLLKGFAYVSGFSAFADQHITVEDRRFFFIKWAKQSALIL